MPESFYDVAQRLHLRDSEVESAIQRAGIACDSEFNGAFIWMFDDVQSVSLNRIMLHTNSFGDFPVVALPAINMLEHCTVMREIINEFGIDRIIQECLRAPLRFANPGLTNSDLFNVVEFLTCLWVDLKQEIYRFRGIPWNPLVSFDTPIYYRSGTIRSWDLDCNIFKANILEFIDSVYKFLLWSFADYSFRGTRRRLTKFPMTLAENADVLRMPGVACLNTTRSRNCAYGMLTTIRRLVAQMCCMLLRRGNDAFIVNNTTEATFVNDMKQLYLFIQKMESFINNG